MSFLLLGKGRKTTTHKSITAGRPLFVAYSSNIYGDIDHHIKLKKDRYCEQASEGVSEGEKD